MNPYPLVGLNHFTVPVAIIVSLLQCWSSCARPAVWRLQRLGNDLRAARIGKLSKADQKSSCHLLVRSARTRVNVIRGLASAKCGRTLKGVSGLFWFGHGDLTAGTCRACGCSYKKTSTKGDAAMKA